MVEWMVSAFQPLFTLLNISTTERPNAEMVERIVSAFQPLFTLRNVPATEGPNAEMVETITIKATIGARATYANSSRRSSTPHNSDTTNGQGQDGEQS